MQRRPSLPSGLLAGLVAAVASLAPLQAQAPGAGSGVRLGATFGGISTVGVVVEYFDDASSVELNVGTWSFKDLSASLTVKQYFGRSALRPFVGAGLWLVAADPPADGERLGLATVLTFPIGADWRFAGRHYTGLTLNVNRALWVRRTDPDDDLPLNDRLVPLPGIYYRWSG